MFNIRVENSTQIRCAERVITDKTILNYFKKIIITGENIKRKTDEKGILTIGLLDFLLDENCI